MRVTMRIPIQLLFFKCIIIFLLMFHSVRKEFQVKLRLGLSAPNSSTMLMVISLASSFIREKSQGGDFPWCSGRSATPVFLMTFPIPYKILVQPHFHLFIIIEKAQKVKFIHGFGNLFLVKSLTNTKTALFNLRVMAFTPSPKPLDPLHFCYIIINA